MSQMIAHPGSWWAHPSVQWDRDAFRAAVAAQEPRWQDEDKRIRQVMAGLATQNWLVGGGTRRGFVGHSAVMS
jgi:hypothetical protein